MRKRKLGIRDEVLGELVSLAKKHSLSKMILYGSRARKDYHMTSDINLAVSGGDLAGFSLDADETTSTLLQFNIVDLGGEVQEELRQAILKGGVVLYEKV